MSLSRTLSILVAAATAIACVIGLSAARAFAAGWVTLTGTPAATSGSIFGFSGDAVDGQGDLWLQFNDGGTLGVFERPPGGTFTQALSLSIGNTTAAIAAGSDGTVAVEWGDPAASQVSLVVRRPGGSFGSPLTVASGAANTTFAGVPAVLPDGTVLAPWEDNTTRVAHVKTLSPGGSLVDETPSGEGSQADVVPQLAVNGAGEAVMMWRDQLSSTIARLAYSVRPAGGTFGPAQAVRTRTLGGGETSQLFLPEQLKLDDAGDILAVWEIDTTTGSGTTHTLQTSVRAAGQSAFPTRTQLDQGTFYYDPGGAFDSSSTVTLTWVDHTGNLDTTTASAAGGYQFAAPSALIAGAWNAGLNFYPPYIGLAPLHGGGLAGLFVQPGNRLSGYLPGGGGPLTAYLEPSGGSLAAGPTLVSSGVEGEDLVPDQAGDAFAALTLDAANPPCPLCFAGNVPIVAYDATPPTLGAITAPSPASAGKRATLSVPASDAISGVTVTWSFGDGGSGSGSSVTHTWATPGSYTVRATATDGAGNTASTERTVTVRDLTPPQITHARLSHSRFAVGKARTAVTARKHKPPTGTSVEFKLSETARVTLTISHTVPGRRSGHSCQPTRDTHLSKKRRCTATVPDGRITRRSERAGSDRIAFSGRIGRRALKPGNYTLQILATDPAGNRSKPRKLRFTIMM